MTADTLILCRTPLQARICLRLIDIGEIDDFDLLYLSQDDNESDKEYFERLSHRATRHQYLYVPRQRFDILNHLASFARSSSRFRRRRYQRIYLASIDNPFFRWILARNRTAEIKTFDDGTGNIMTGSVIRAATDTGRMRVYARLARLPSPGAVRARSSAHFTLYDGLDNIVPSEKLRPIQVFSSGPHVTDLSHAPVTFFLGQPFEEYLAPDAVERIRKHLAGYSVDYYVRHPRERSQLVPEIPLLAKDGEIAEVAILRAAGSAPVRVIAGFSSVLFNLTNNSVERVYLSVASDERESERCELARRAGCEVLDLRVPERQEQLG